MQNKMTNPTTTINTNNRN